MTTPLCRGLACMKPLPNLASPTEAAAIEYPHISSTQSWFGFGFGFGLGFGFGFGFGFGLGLGLGLG